MQQTICPSSGVGHSSLKNNKVYVAVQVMVGRVDLSLGSIANTKDFLFCLKSPGFFLLISNPWLCGREICLLCY